MQAWRPKNAGDVPNGLILFDGVCVLCSRSMQFVLKRDTAAWFRFTPIQSPYGRLLAQRFGIDPNAPQSNAVIVRGCAQFKSDSIIAVLARLPHWRLLRVLALIPRPLRHGLYDRIAQNRYRLFGRTATCMLPPPGVAARFVLDAASADAPMPGRASPFQHLLGGAFDTLPAPVRRVHAAAHSLNAAGLATIEAAPGLLPGLLRWFAGLPASGKDVPVVVGFHPDGPLREFWQRQFGHRRYASTLHVDGGPGLLTERLGLIDLEFRLVAGIDGLRWSVAGWRILGLRLPSWTTPRIECCESADGERFRFDIDVAFPVIGQVVRYGGWLDVPAPSLEISELKKAGG